MCVCGLMHAIVNTFMTVGAEMRAWHHFQIIHWHGQSHSPVKERGRHWTCVVFYLKMSLKIGVKAQFIKWNVKIGEKSTSAVTLLLLLGSMTSALTDNKLTERSLPVWMIKQKMLKCYVPTVYHLLCDSVYMHINENAFSFTGLGQP